MGKENVELSKKEYIAESIFLVCLGIYLLFLTQNTTTFFFPIPSNFEKNFLIIISTVVLVKTLLVFKEKWLICLSLCVFAVYGGVYYSDRYFFLLYLAVITVGCVGINYRKILCTYLCAVGSVVVISIISALGGAITNYVYFSNGYTRSSWGICYPTDLASYVLYLLLILWICCKKLSDEVMLFLSLISFYIARYVARSDTSTICSVLLFFVLFYQILERRILCHYKKYSKFRNLIDIALQSSFPAFGVVVFLLMYGYQKGFRLTSSLNELLSGRLKLAVDAYQTHGIRAFGVPFDQIGGGFSTFASPDYNFVDSTYPLILIRYGWVLLGVICILWVGITKKAIRCNNRRLAFSMAIIALHSVSEHHFMEINYNILLVMPFAAYQVEGSSICGKKFAHSIKESLSYIPGICCGLLFAAAFPTLLSWMRTICTKTHLTGGGKNSVIVFLCLLLMIVVCALFVWALTKIWQDIWGHLKIERPMILLVLMSTMILGGILVKCNRMISDAAVDYADMIEADRSAMELITASADGKIYVDKLGEVYYREFGKISTSVFNGDELARYQGITIVMDRNYDSNCLINSVFLFSEISEYHAVYTNDQSVIRALSEAGYHLTGYYSIRKAVDFNLEAKINNLERNDKGGLCLSGTDHSLIFGPYLDLHAGKYTASYQLEMDKDQAYDENDILCTLRVSAYSGQQILIEKDVYAGDFDSDGQLSMNIPFSIGNYRGIEFLAFAKDDKQISINEITYQRTPEYDVHIYLDDSKKKIREEYYSLAGEPVELDKGYAACEFEYDRKGNINVLRYYDLENNPVIASSGYAEVHRKFNEKRRIIREEYYGIDGQPLMLSGGYAINEREYDEAGNAVIQRYYAADGSAVLTQWGYAEVHREFNEKRQVIREEYYGTDSQALTLSGGYAINEREYDEAGNAVVQRYYSEDGTAVLTQWGYAEVHRNFDEKRQVIREEYYGTDGQPLTLPGGYAINEREYDEVGNAVVQRYYAADGTAVLASSGYAEVHREFNEKRQVIREEYYGTDGQALTLPGGYAINEREYNEAGNAVVQRYYAADGSAVLTQWGYAEVHREFNEKRQVIREEYYGTDGQALTLPGGYAINEREYNEAGNAVVQRYYAADGSAVLTQWGYAEVHREFNEKRQVIREEYYGTDGQPLTLSGGYAINEREYDENGKVKVQRFYDIAGNIVSEKH